MKRAHAAIFLLFVVDKLVFFFYFEMEYEGILVLASQYEKYKTKTKKLVPKKKMHFIYYGHITTYPLLVWPKFMLHTYSLKFHFTYLKWVQLDFLNPSLLKTWLHMWFCFNFMFLSSKHTKNIEYKIKKNPA